MRKIKGENNMLTFPEIKNPSIYIVGGGGTGGFAFTNLSRLFAGTNTPIHVFDGDIVEPKNLKRQQFSKDDVDSNKATSLVNTAEKTILDHSPLKAHDQYITDEDEFLADILMSLPEDGTPIIISAVDNVATRHLINRSIASLDNFVAIDSGNNNQGGQVVVTTNQLVKKQDDPFRPSVKTKLANMFDVYPELNNIDDKNPGLDRSCDEVVESEPQAMMANSRNGDIIANIVTRLVENKPLSGNVFESNLEDFATKVRTVIKR